MNRTCRDQYFDRYMDYLRERTDAERKVKGQAPYSDVTLKTMATDTFYLEKREEKGFKEWLKDKETLDEAYDRLVYHLSGRKKPESDARYYLDCMVMFKDFLDQTH